MSNCTNIYNDNKNIFYKIPSSYDLDMRNCCSICNIPIVQKKDRCVNGCYLRKLQTNTSANLLRFSRGVNPVTFNLI